MVPQQPVCVKSTAKYERSSQQWNGHYPGYLTPVFIHPMDKETVGNRLALWALSQTYGREGFGYATPIYKSMEISGNKIYINVDNASTWTLSDVDST